MSRLPAFFYILVLCVPCVAAGLPVPPQADSLGMQGTWIPGSNSSPDTGWRLQDKELQFVLSPQVKSEDYEVTLKDPLPNGDWTMDIFLKRDTCMTLVDINIGDPQTGGCVSIRLSPDGNYYSCKYLNGTKQKPLPTELTGRWGCTQWIRLAYQQSQGKLAMCVNAQPVFWKDEDVRIPPGPVRLVVPQNSWCGMNSGGVRIFAFTVTPGATVDFDVQGTAFNGWSKPLKGDALRDVGDLDSRMESIYNAATDDTGRCYAMAARVLAERARGGSISAATWTRVGALVEGLLPRDRVGLSSLLPIVIACGDAAQREEAKAWVSKFFDVPYMTKWNEMKATGHTMSRAILLDPVKSMRMGFPLSRGDIDYMCKSLSVQMPEIAAMPIGISIGEENYKSEMVAWYLPRIYELSPNYERVCMEVLKEFRKSPVPQPGEPDRTLSFAAYRIAPLNLAAATEFLDGIKAPDVKAETLQYISDMLAGNGSADAGMAGEIEALLKQSVQDWKPTVFRATPVDAMMKLARFYESNKEWEKADAVVAQAVQKAGDGKNLSGDLRLIAEYKMRRGSKDAGEWFDKAVNAAQAADEARGDTPDRSPDGSIYISGLQSLIADLLAKSDIDGAVALAGKMNKSTMILNRSRALDRIIHKVIGSDMDKAIFLLDEYPNGASKNGVKANIAAKMAGTDLNAALAMIADIRGRSRTSALFKIAHANPRDMTAVIDELKAAVAQTVKPSSGPLAWGLDKAAEDYARLPLGVFSAMQDSFKKNPNLYAAYMLSCIAEKCGVWEDPLWMQYSGINRPASIPWSTSRLRYMVEASGQ